MPKPSDYSTLGAAEGVISDLVIGIDHVGLCVSKIDAAGDGWTALLGQPVVDKEDVAPQKTTASFIRFGKGAAIEFVSPMEGNAALDRFLEKRGDALHHLAIAVTDIKLALSRLKAAGIALIDETPRTGAGGHQVGFIHPRAVGGVLVELIEQH